jgi:fibronectin type 3 domain-containing protein
VDAAGNESLPSNAVTVTLADTQAPTTPPALAAAVTGRTINLSWGGSTDDGTLAGYDVFRNGAKLAQVPGTSYADGGTAFGQTYDYAVRAVDSAGNVSSLCAAVRITLTDATPPDAPTGLTAAVSGTRVDLTWNVPADNDAVAGYRLYKNGSLAASPVTNAYTETVAIGVSTIYFVRAVDPSGNLSAAGDPISVLIPDVTAPTAPAALTAAVGGGGTTGDLAWTASQDDAAVTAYKVYRDGALRGTTPTAAYSDDIRVGGTVEELGPGKSTYLNGSASLTFPRSNDWDFGTGDFTVDHWYRFDTLKHTYFWSRLSNGASGTEMALRWITSNQIDVYLDDVAVVTAPWTPLPGVWYHLTVSRAAGAVRFFVNGVQVGPTGVSLTKLSSNQPFNVGSPYGNFPKGWVDEFRISNSARWTTNFSPLIERYSPDAQTKLLLRAGYSIAEPFKDVSASAHIVQTQGAVVDATQYKVGEKVVVSSPVAPPPGTVHSYSVSALDAAGNESLPSNTATLTT